MKKIITLFGLILLISCSKSEENAIFINQNITPVLIAKGSLMGSENISAQKIAIYDSVNWNNIIGAIDQFRLAQFTETTTIDFNNYQLIAVFDEVYGNPTYEFKILSVVENAINIVVIVEKTYNPSIVSVITQEYHIVKIPKTNKPVIFQ